MLKHSFVLPCLLFSLLALGGLSAQDGENLLPNGDLGAGDAGFKLYYKGANGQPLINLAKVYKMKDGVMTIDPSAAGPLKGGMLLLIDIPQEDISEGTTYTLSFEAKSEVGQTNFMMVMPGEVEPGKFTPDKENKGFTGKIKSDWTTVSKTFTTDAKYKNNQDEFGITFLLAKVDGPISLRNFELKTR